MSKMSPRALLLALAAVCATAVGLALVAQHQYNMQPCPWCILQRVLFIVVGALALVGALINPMRRAVSGVAAGLALGGIAAALWQHFVAAKTNSCALTFADKVIATFGLDARWPDWFEVRANCSEAAASILGAPFEFWSLALFAVSVAVLMHSTLTPTRRA